MPRYALVLPVMACSLLCLHRPAESQALIDQMPLADLQRCGALAFEMWTGRQDVTVADESLKTTGAAIRAESASVDAARRTVPVRDPAAVKHFNARVNALNARVADYGGQMAVRNARSQKTNDVAQQFNVLCAHRPYDPALLGSLPPAQAQAMSRGATSVAIPMIDNTEASAVSPPTSPPAGQLVIGGPTPAAAAPATGVSGEGGFKTADDVRAAAAKGDAEAQYLLGSALITGGPFGRDDATGLAWLVKSADQSNAKALFALSVMYDEGRGAPVDEAKSHVFLVKAAGLGDAQAEHNLAVWYAARDHDDRASANAVVWMTKAAGQGDPESQFLLSDYLAKGFAGAAAGDDVVTWLRRSAMQGYRPAELEIARRYEKADGLPRDLVEALKWDLLAAGGVSDADRLDASRGCLRTALEDTHTHDIALASVGRLQGKLTPEESDRAGRLAEAWRTSSTAKAVGGCG